MQNEHPRYKKWIVGTWELVWQDISGKPTIDIKKKAHIGINGALVWSGTPGSEPTNAIGWQIDLKKTDGTPWMNDQGQAGWSTYPKHHDAKPVFTGREYPLLLPKVAATLRNIHKKTHDTLNQTPEESLKTLESDPEKYATYLLTNIAHHLEKWLKKGPGFGAYHTATDISLEVHDHIWGESRPWIRIRQWNKAYKIVPSNAYARDTWRHAWSIHIDTTNAPLEDISRAHNFKLLPVWNANFEAKICLDTKNYTPLSAENRALLESVLTLFKGL